MWVHFRLRCVDSLRAPYLPSSLEEALRSSLAAEPLSDCGQATSTASPLDRVIPCTVCANGVLS